MKTVSASESVERPRVEIRGGSRSVMEEVVLGLTTRMRTGLDEPESGLEVIVRRVMLLLQGRREHSTGDGCNILCFERSVEVCAKGSISAQA